MRMPKVKKSATVADLGKKPLGALSSFTWYMKQSWAEFKKQYPGVSIPLIPNMKLLSDSWKNLSEELKKPFKDLAAADKLRYNDEMRRYNPTFKPPKIRGSRMKMKDPNHPRTPLNSYLWFCDEERPKLKERQPNMTYAESNSELGRLWKEIDPKRKEIYKKLGARDHARYAKEMKEYRIRIEMAAEVDAECESSSTVSGVENENSCPPESPSSSTSTMTSTSIGVTGPVGNSFEDSRESGFETMSD